MYDCNGVVAVAVGVSVYIGRRSVGRPSGVADTDCAFKLRIADNLLQIADFTYMFSGLNLSIPVQGDPRGVIASVLQPFQPLYNNFFRIILRADVSNNTAHNLPPN